MEQKPVQVGPERDALKAKRVELLLQQIEALPTLRSVAVRVLEATADERSDTRQVIGLISKDPALSAKVIKLCRCSEHGRGLDVRTLDRAVSFLGFESVRSAVLSIEAFELLDGTVSQGGEGRKPRGSMRGGFDRSMFWRHSLAVAVMSEVLGELAKKSTGLKASEAFLAGLLHDLGMLSLHLLLPESLDKVCDLAEARGVSLDQACMGVIGMDTHTAGKRLAEHWQLPHSLGDVMWLCGQRLEGLPELGHRSLIGLVTLADALARSRGWAPMGHGPRGEDIEGMCAQLGISVEAAELAADELRDKVREHADALGIDVSGDDQSLIRALARANTGLGRLNASLRERASTAKRQADALTAITAFHDSASPGGDISTVLAKVIQSAAGIFGGGFFCVLYQSKVDEPWQVMQFAIDGRVLRSDLVDPPKGSTAVSTLADTTQVSMDLMGMLPWLSDYFGDARDVRQVQLLPLKCGWGVNAVLIHDCEVDGREAHEQLDALSRTWAAAIAAAAQHEGAKRLGEQLATTNRTLVETQQELARTAAMASLGEMAAGAAHEMNNPLTVISGRSQILAQRTTDKTLKAMAEQIVDQSHRLSNLITGLRNFAEPTKAAPKWVNLPELLAKVAHQVKKEKGEARPVKVIVEQQLGSVWVDSEHLRRAVYELVKNAIEAQPATQVEIRVQIEPVDDRLMIRITDDGKGMTEQTLMHAFDPFFSVKPAGRQTGLGLAYARRLIEASGGRLTLEQGKPSGAIAVIRLTGWRTGDGKAKHAA
ncbi:MAG TPA: HDOD domain-containing protein [Phycisphaerales bacterium]|nr:HDOD domain-containing protein [Phycisphaerales bacterium]